MPIGLMIAAWTSYNYIVFIAPLIGFTLFGIGFFIVISAILNCEQGRHRIVVLS